MIKESPLWLAAKGRDKEVRTLLEKRRAVHSRSSLEEPPASAAVLPNAHIVYGRLATWAMGFIWVTAALNYMGISLGIGRLGGNLYLHSALCSLSEVPACLVAAY